MDNKNLIKGMLTSLVMASLIGCSAVTGRETAGEYMEDASLTAAVKAEILREPTLNSYQIHVETFKDEVQLSGFVDTSQQVRKAGEVARRVQGVRSVKNNLTVR